MSPPFVFPVQLQPSQQRPPPLFLYLTPTILATVPCSSFFPQYCQLYFMIISINNPFYSSAMQLFGMLDGGVARAKADAVASVHVG